MPTKKRTPRLGRGLSSLMAQPVAVDPPSPETPPVSVMPTPEAAPPLASPPALPLSTPRPANTDGDLPATDAVRLEHLDPSLIQPNPHQPRQTFDTDALQRLADSISQDGLMQPVVVRPRPDDQTAYELIAGERRWRAAQLAGLAALPAIVRDVDDDASAELALIENLQREDLNPIEKAEAFERFANDHGLSHDAIAQRVGLERSTVANLIRLLALAPPVRAWTAEGKLSMGQARAIAGLPDSDHQQSLARQAIEQGLSVRAVEAKAKAIKAAPVTEAGKGAAAPNPGPDLIQDLSQQISDQLQTKASVKRGRKKHAGSIMIEFFSLDQFDSLMERMGVEIR